MAGGDISAWRRQNSDPVQVVLTLIDGTTLRGTLLQPRDKTLREVFNMGDAFIDFECELNGEMIIAKSSVRALRKHIVPNADQLDKKLSALEKADPYRILGIGRSASREEIHQAYVALARSYHPDRFASVNLPPEVAEYFETMARRINVAYSELAGSVRQTTAGEPASDPARSAA